MRAGASRAIASALGASMMPAPAATVSRACASGVSPSATAAAMPPCAQTLDAPAPIGAPVSNVTGRGASLSAQNRPANPPPTMTMLLDGRVEGMRLSCSPDERSEIRGRPSRIPLCSMRATTWSALQMDHPLDRAARLVGHHRVDGDLVVHGHQAVENLRQRDPLHVRADVARLHELDVRQFD